MSQVAGAVLRAALMVVLVALPSLMLPGASGDLVQLVMLLALFVGALTFAEYAATYPALVEFRYAPPFNRLRFVALFLTLGGGAIVLHGDASASLHLWTIAAAGWLGEVLSLPFGPVRLLVLSLQADLTPDMADRLRDAASLAAAVALVTVAVFAVLIRLRGWPLGRGRFNVWVNLPTFDPTAGRDVVGRLERDAVFNLALGIFLPFLLPVAVLFGIARMGLPPVTTPHLLVWIVATWAFLPMSLVMRGLAMARLARLIRDTRATHAASERADLQAV